MTASIGGVSISRWGVLLAGALVACQDPSRPLPEDSTPALPITAHDQNVEIYRTDGDSAWNYYAADVQVVLAQQDLYGYSGAEGYRDVAYHIERTLGGNNLWATVANFAPYLPEALDGSGNTAMDIARVEFDGAGTPRLYDRQGSLVVPDTNVISRIGIPDAADSLPQPAFGFTPDSRPNLAVSPNPRGGASSNSREWLDEIVVTPQSRVRLSSRRARLFGGAQGQVRGLNRFISNRTRRGRVHATELLVDPGLGAVVERNDLIDGRLAARALYTFAQVNDTTFVRTGTRFEVPAPGRPGRLMVVRHELSKIRVERRNGGN